MLGFFIHFGYPLKIVFAFICGAPLTLPSKTGVLTPTGIDFLVNTAAVANLVGGGPGMRNSMYATHKLPSFHERVNAFVKEWLADPSCNSFQVLLGCQYHSFNCGMPGRQMVFTPGGNYHYIQWKDLFLMDGIEYS
jgi:hypothetical protein